MLPKKFLGSHVYLSIDKCGGELICGINGVTLYLEDHKRHVSKLQSYIILHYIQIIGFCSWGSGFLFFFNLRSVKVFFQLARNFVANNIVKELNYIFNFISFKMYFKYLETFAVCCLQLYRYSYVLYIFASFSPNQNATKSSINKVVIKYDPELMVWPQLIYLNITLIVTLNITWSNYYLLCLVNFMITTFILGWYSIKTDFCQFWSHILSLEPRRMPGI